MDSPVSLENLGQKQKILRLNSDGTVNNMDIKGSRSKPCGALKSSPLATGENSALMSFANDQKYDSDGCTESSSVVDT